MSRISHKERERILRLGRNLTVDKPEAQGSLAAPSGSASVLELGHAKSNDAHCLHCGFQLRGGANVGLCPKGGSGRWYRGVPARQEIPKEAADADKWALRLISMSSLRDFR